MSSDARQAHNPEVGASNPSLETLSSIACFSPFARDLSGRRSASGFFIPRVVRVRSWRLALFMAPFSRPALITADKH